MDIDKYFGDTVGQTGLKKELFEAYVGSASVGLPLPHGLLLSSPGFGKSDCFVPGIAAMTGFSVVGPFGASLNMKLDPLMDKVSVQFELVKAQGLKPLIVIEELSNIGKPNTGRLLTWLSDGYFTTLTGDVWYAGQPGVDWFLVSTSNDDGRFLDALKSRLVTFRFDNYTVEELTEIGSNFAYRATGSEPAYSELLEVAALAESPREMIFRVRRMLGLAGLGQDASADAVHTSLRLDEDGLHIDAQRTLVAVLDLGGRTPLAALAKKLKNRAASVEGWVLDLVEAGFVDRSGSGPGGGVRLTFAGKKKAAELKVRI